MNQLDIFSYFSPTKPGNPGVAPSSISNEDNSHRQTKAPIPEGELLIFPREKQMCKVSYLLMAIQIKY